MMTRLLAAGLCIATLMAATAPRVETAAGADLQNRTLQAFDRYVKLTEARLTSSTAFVPSATIDQAFALLQNYDAHQRIYAPTVAASKLRSRDGDRFTFFLRFVMKKVITVVVNSEHVGVFRRPAADRAEGWIHSTRIAEVEESGTPAEREKPVGHDGGYLWRLNTYWRLQARDGGLYIHCESVSLSRGIPFGVGWIVKPFVTSIPRESLTFTLDTTRKQLGSGSR